MYPGRARLYVNNSHSIAFEWMDCWTRADIVNDRAVAFDKFDDTYLDAKQCRILAEWLLDAADYIE